MPEQDELLAEYENFGVTGYGSSYAFVNMGTNIIVITFLFLFMILLLATLPCKKDYTRFGRYRRKCSRIIYWNFWLRFHIQGCLEISIAICIYIAQRKKLFELLDTEYNTYLFMNDCLSFIEMTCIFLLTSCILIFYCCKFKKLSEEQFD